METVGDHIPPSAERSRESQTSEKNEEREHEGKQKETWSSTSLFQSFENCSKNSVRYSRNLLLFFFFTFP